MTTPPPADNDPEPAGGWALPGAPPPAGPTGPMPAGPPMREAPPPPGGPPPMGLSVRTNRLAIAALVTGLLGLVLLAVGLAIAALIQAGRRGETGKGLAVGGLVASAVWTVAGAVAVVAFLGSLVSAERDGFGNVTDKDKVLAAMLRVGDCFNGFEGDRIAPLVTALPCTQPHEGEAVAKLQLSGDEYPGDGEIRSQANDACDRKTLQLWKSRYARDLVAYNITPTRSTWDTGDRELFCLLRYTGSGTLTSPLAQTLDPDLRFWYELAPGDCLGKWDEEAWAQRLLSCTEPHWNLVFATFTLKAGPYPGQKAADRKAERGCEKRWQTVFRGHPSPDLIGWSFPEKSEWDTGHRTIVCFGKSEDRPMKKSMLPR
ncbi:septum formation family protein [Spirillospora sp. NPDC048819]|uniref:septum formation family protein n=1 Tax=Spirillospora sp. NPDC048819 TaxID=3155268 RepID=UPI00340F383E